MNGKALTSMPAPPRAFLTALGHRDPPDSITVGGESYALAKVFKNDFFAITCLYRGKSDKIVLNINRKASGAGMTLGWVGRFVCAPERSSSARRGATGAAYTA